MKKKKYPENTEKYLTKLEKVLRGWTKKGWRYKVQKWYIGWRSKERLTLLIKRKFMRWLRR